MSDPGVLSREARAHSGKHRRMHDAWQEGKLPGLLLIKGMFAVGLSIIMLMRLLGGGDF